MRVGVVGVGWGALVQAPAFRAVDGFELVALCARTPRRLGEVSKQLGISDVSTDWRSFVRRDDLDLVSIVTPVALHRDIAVAALAAGKHVLCEKPLALTEAEAREMVEAAAASGRTTACCFELRWSRDRLRVWELVRSEFLGQPYYARVSQSAGYWHPSRKLQELWMYDLEQGGGYLNGLVSHDVDWICTMLGEPIAVSADVRTTVSSRRLPDGGELAVTADDTSALLLRLRSGALAVLSASVVGVHAGGYQFELFGSAGTISGGGDLRSGPRLFAGKADERGLTELSPSDREPKSGAEIPAGLAGSAIRAMALMLEDWLPAFRAGKTLAPSWADGWRVQKVIEAARLSARGAGWVEIAKA